MSKKLFLALLAVLALTTQSYAAPGDLDSTFGTGGLVNYSSGLNTSDWAVGVALLPDGKILVAGNTHATRTIIRYFPDGTLDQAFGSGSMGIVSVPSVLGHIRAMAVDPQGRVVLAHDCEPVGLKEICVSRYTETGIPDTTFGAGTTTPGSAHTGFDSSSNSFATSLVIDQGGRIVVGGYTYVNPTPTTYEKKFALARYLANGILDGTFGGGTGLVITDIPSSTVEQINALAIDGERIVAVGKSNVGTALPRLAIVRYLPDGTLDFSFDGDGIVENSSVREGQSVALQDDGKIVVGGILALARYNANGSLDLENFGGGDGIATLSGWGTLAGVGIGPDGKILAAGITFLTATVTNSDFVVARFTAIGEPDTSYGVGGKRSYDFGGGDDVVNALALQPDGRAVLAGYTREPGSTTTPPRRDWAIARYLGESADLDLTMSDSPDPVTAGETLTYNLTVTNNGPDRANSVNLTSTLPTGVTLVSATPSQGSCAGTATVTCGLGSLTIGTSANITLAVAAPSEAGTLVNTATVSGFYFDANTANHQPQESTAVALAVAEAATEPVAAVTPPPGPVGGAIAPAFPEVEVPTGVSQEQEEVVTTVDEAAAPARTGGGGGCSLHPWSTPFGG